ncbi:hypothetical protein T484DRAFT_1786631 [Baffinella frigidus]|nr:hypothetical protein T484DRAFT_1786631 [Cryptophyta sp. CCMP2293]
MEQVLQLDDGYAQWGDWEKSSPRFPGGVRDASEAAARHSLTPGLWIAPFAADFGSEVVRDHPEWILRCRNSSLPANSGFTAGG